MASVMMVFTTSFAKAEPVASALSKKFSLAPLAAGMLEGFLVDMAATRYEKRSNKCLREGV